MTNSIPFISCQFSRRDLSSFERKRRNNNKKKARKEKKKKKKVRQEKKKKKRKRSIKQKTNSFVKVFVHAFAYCSANIFLVSYVITFFFALYLSY